MQKKLQRVLMVLASIGLILTILVNFDFQSRSFPPRITGTTMQVGIALDYPPYEFLRQGQPVGYSADLANLLAQKMGFKIKIEDMEFQSLIPSLRSKQIDFAISSISVTKDRMKYVDFTRPYYISKAEIITHKDKKIEQLSQLSNCRIGAQMGTTFSKYLKKKFGDSISIIEFADMPSLIEEFTLLNLDAIMLDIGVARRSMGDMANFNTIYLEDFEEKNAIALPKNSGLVKKFNIALNKLEKEGELRKLEEKWSINIQNDR